jgi:hypothetical protein
MFQQTAHLISSHQVLHSLLVDRRGHDQRRELHFLDRVHISLNHSVHQTPVEAVSGGDHHMQRGISDIETSRLRQGVQQIEGCASLLLLILHPQSRGGGRGQQRFLGGLGPALAHIDDGGSHCTFLVHRFEFAVEEFGDLSVVHDIIRRRRR